LVAILGCSTPGANPTIPNTDSPTQTDDPDRPAGLATGEVTWIADGDTIDVDTGDGVIEVRLLGVNAPEKNECYGNEALDYLIDVIKAKTVGLEISGEDQFGRTLASVWSEDELINLVLTRGGYAIALTPGDSDPYGPLLLAAEDRAYASGRGLWSDNACGATSVLPDLSFDIVASQFDPKGPDDEVLDNEYLVIANNGDTSIDMGGWVLRDESSRNRLVFDGQVTLAGGARLTISSGCSTNPGWCGTRSIWNNGGDMALLLDASGRVVARSRY
jgi:endonuclease YncB( thermonuclease family)